MRFREMKKPKRMARACIQVTLASMAAIIGLAGCGTPPTEVKEANANPDAFLAKNYTLQALRISGCPGGIARGRKPHGAAQQSGVDDGRRPPAPRAAAARSP